MAARVDPDRARRERDLFRALVELPFEREPARLLSRVLQLVRAAARASVGYIELTDDTTGHQRQWSEHYGLEGADLERVQDRVSRGVIGEARATGEIVHVPSALLDDRFATRESVRSAEIEAVLCVPLSAEGLSGVLYLQGRLGGGAFDDEDVECAQVVANFVTSHARLLLELILRCARADATREIRTRVSAEGILGRSPAIARMLQRLEVIAQMEDNVLLTGPAGCGKSTLARVVHDNSRRAKHPFIELNAPTIAHDRLEVELFGAAPGAYTGAPAGGVQGKVAVAEPGTLFLDEIGEVSAEVQAKLLQFLQTKQYFPVGSPRPRTADVRLIAATNRDLDAAVATGLFRRDLHDRLRGMELRVPPLDARREDIPQLVESFCERICAANGLVPMGVSPVALAHLEFSAWPGNIRELMNRCRDAVVSARIDGVTTIELRHLFEDEGADIEAAATFRRSRDQWERTFLATALGEVDWNVSLAAKRLELSRSYLNAKIKKHALTRGE